VATNISSTDRDPRQAAEKGCAFLRQRRTWGRGMNVHEQQKFLRTLPNSWTPSHYVSCCRRVLASRSGRSRYASQDAMSPISGKVSRTVRETAQIKSLSESVFVTPHAQTNTSKRRLIDFAGLSSRDSASSRDVGFGNFAESDSGGLARAEAAIFPEIWRVVKSCIGICSI